MENKWIISPLSKKQEETQAYLAKELNIQPVSAAMLVRRGITTPQEARDFIQPKLQDLHDPFLMKDMDKAVVRLTQAIENKEKILIYGDYDVDGTTAVALVYNFLSAFYDNLDFYIPDRYNEGYGISTQGIDYAEQTHCSLIIALDCGIRSVDKVEYAKQKSIDFIICDHHLPSSELPQAVAVLDQKRADCPYPYKDLSGCGVGFKLMQAYSITHKMSLDLLYSQLGLLAMSIASDIVQVTGENRILAYHGLQSLNKRPSVGVKALIDIAGLSGNTLNITDLAFRIGPRINACGRIHTGRDAVRLLITNDSEMAQQMSLSVEENNQRRKDLDQNITTEALDILQSDPSNQTNSATVVCGKDWHKGVIGIVASRLTETYYRPTIVLTEVDGIVSGSARSVGGFDIYSAIDSCHDLLTNFGGHVYAAGLSMEKKNYAEFKARFEKYVSEHILPEQQQLVIKIEEQLRFQDITRQFFRILECMEPFGPGNPRPIFMTTNTSDYRYNSRRVGKQQEHLKLDLTDGSGSLQGIGFGFGKADWIERLHEGEQLAVCYELQKNTFNGQTTIQMMVEDIKTANNTF